MSRKHKHEEHVNHERWLVSYADFITLLFAFFTVMYALSIVDQKRMKEVAGAVRFAFHMDGSGGSLEPGRFSSSSGASKDALVAAIESEGRRGVPFDERMALVEIKQKIEERLTTGLGGSIPRDVLELLVTEEGLRIRLLQAYFFDAGSSIMRPEAIRVLDAMGPVLGPIPNSIRIEGHTDPGGPELVNWRLSADRSLAIIHYFIEGARLDPRRLALAAYGYHRPVATNESLEGRALNRRIDLMVLFRPPEPETTPAVVPEGI